MSLLKIGTWLALALAVIAAFVMIPYAALALVVLGLVGGSQWSRDDSIRVIVTAMFLVGVTALDAVPQVGTQLGAILGNLGQVAAGASIALIARNIWARLS